MMELHMGLEVVTYTKQDGATTCDYCRHHFQMIFFSSPSCCYGAKVGNKACACARKPGQCNLALMNN